MSSLFINYEIPATCISDRIPRRKWSYSSLSSNAAANVEIDIEEFPPNFPEEISPALASDIISYVSQLTSK